MQQLQALLALAHLHLPLAGERVQFELLRSLLDVVDGSPVERRQGGKVATYAVLVRGREVAEVGEVVIAVVRGERNQEQQKPGKKS